MATRKSAKIVFLTALVVLMIGMVFSMGTSAEEDAELKPQIISQNIEYSTYFKLMYAVDAASVTGPVELRVYIEYPTEEIEDTYIKKYTVSKITPASETGNLGKDAYIFLTDGVSYTGLTDEFYILAIDLATGKKSDVKRYSVAEYLYERLADPEATEIQKNLYKRTIQFGADMQKVLYPDTEESKLISNLRYVVVDGGDFGGYKAGLFAVGDTIAPYGAMVSKWDVSYTGEGGKALKTYNNLSSLTVPNRDDLVKISFSVGETFSYPDGFDDLESYANWDAMQSALISGMQNSPTVALALDGEHGNVGKFSFTKDRTISFGKFNTGVSPTAATAYVASFDLKVDAANAEYTRSSLEVRFCDDAGSTTYARVQLQVLTDGKTAKLGLGSEGNWAASNKFYTIKTDGWVNVKLVQYDGDENIYLYVNGDTDNPVFITNTRTQMSDINYDISSIGITRFAYGNGTDGIDFYFDNVFFGFTNETIPEPEPEPVKSIPDDLDDYVDWNAMQAELISGTSAASGSLIHDAEKGSVGKVTFLAAGGYLRFNKFNTGVSSTDATAFVASFDLKIDLSDVEDVASKRASIDLKFRDSSNNQYMRVQLEVIKNGDTTKIGLGHDSNWAQDAFWYTVETTEWLNVKVAQYEGNSSIYLYINEDIKHPVIVQNQKTAAVDSNYTIDDLSYVDIGWGNNMDSINVYFDNVFFGFTEDPDPIIKKIPDTLESYADSAEMKSELIYTTSGSPSVEIVNDAEKGNVGKYTLKSGSAVGFKSFNTDVSSTEANAFVASFNMKVDTTNRTETTAGGSIELRLNTDSVSYMRIQLQVIKDSATSKFGVGIEGNWAGTFCDVDTTDWFEVKIVQYKGESTKFHVYVNGTKIYELNDNGNAARANVVDNYSEDLYVRFAPGNTVTDVDFYFDDVFFGYTTDTNPNAAQ